LAKAYRSIIIIMCPTVSGGRYFPEAMKPLTDVAVLSTFVTDDDALKSVPDVAEELDDDCVEVIRSSGWKKGAGEMDDFALDEEDEVLGAHGMQKNGGKIT
jgi:hypothetical protein